MTDQPDGVRPSRLVTSAVEDYLKALFELGEQSIKTQALAAALAVSPASVTGMLRKLSELHLIEYEPYQGASLTPAGRKMALETVRHHRLIETYLAEALGYEWHEVHDEAEKLEHHISEEFEDRIADVLGHPTHDPHGDPIPARDGRLPDDTGSPLVNWDVGTRLRITRITDQRSEVLRYLDTHGLVPGSEVIMVDIAPLSGPLTLVRDGHTLAVSFELAERIHAARLPSPSVPIASER
ncbi:MAG: metal-dependent transcriptional regulator [Trueperaceae bacterium]